MIRTVPGGKVGPAGGCGTDDGDDGGRDGVPSPPDCPTTSADADDEHQDEQRDAHDPARSGRRSPDDRISVGGSAAAGGRAGGASTGEDWTATPGPAGVATSDQAVPLHQRTIPADAVGVGVPARRRGRLRQVRSRLHPRTAGAAVLGSRRRPAAGSVAAP